MVPLSAELLSALWKGLHESYASRHIQSACGKGLPRSPLLNPMAHVIGQQGLLAKNGHFAWPPQAVNGLSEQKHRRHWQEAA